MSNSKPHTLKGCCTPGKSVLVVQKPHQKTGQLTYGTIKDVLTNSREHHRGIKVRLTSGVVGRVQEILD